MMDWILTDNAAYDANRLGVGIEEIVKVCENPEWTYASSVYDGASVAVGGRLAVPHDVNNRIVLGVTWQSTWRRK